MGTIWEDILGEEYPTIKTPPRLAQKLKEGLKEGKFSHNYFLIDFRVVREDESAWVVKSERINRSGGSAGGTYYVSKKNPNKAVWD